MKWLDGITHSVNMSLSKLPGDNEGQGSLVHCSLWGRRVRQNLVTKQQELKIAQHWLLVSLVG